MREKDVLGIVTFDLIGLLPIFFFQTSLRNCISCVDCDDHYFIFISFPQLIYDLFHISLTLISFTGTYEPTIDLLPMSLAS